MNLVKQGKMTIDEAVNQVKDSPSAAAVSTAAICCFSCSFPDCFYNFFVPDIVGAGKPQNFAGCDRARTSQYDS